MNFIFLYEKIIMGGIETLMARMSRWLVNNGHAVAVISHTIDEDMYNMFDNRVIVKSIIDYHTLHRNSKRRINEIIDYSINFHVDVVLAFSPTALRSAVAVARSLSGACRLMAGVWGPEMYCNYSLKSVVKEPSNYIFHDILGKESKLFMNETCKENIEKTSGKKVDGLIWPLPVDGYRFEKIKREPRLGKIVSVGRLGVLKEYNIGMIDVVKKLIDNSYAVQWFVYGSGPYKNKMEEKISRLGLENDIFLMGDIDYHQMHNVFHDAWLFVGMGTAIVEAAFACVPAIAVSPFKEDPTTYGYFNELPGYNVGESLESSPKDFYGMIKKILIADRETYEEMGRDCYNRAQLFSLEMRMAEFIKNLENIECCHWKNKVPIIYDIALMLRGVNRRIKFIK